MKIAYFAKLSANITTLIPPQEDRPHKIKTIGVPGLNSVEPRRISTTILIAPHYTKSKHGGQCRQCRNFLVVKLKELVIPCTSH